MGSLDPGQLNIEVTLENPSAAEPDGDGGFTQTWTRCQPGTAWASIKGARRGSRERVAHATVIGQAVWDVEIRYHPDVTNQTRLTWVDRGGASQTANVRDVDDVDARGERLNLICVGTVE